MKLSLIELGIHTAQSTKQQAVKDMIYTAQAIESIGFHRLWLAEHHHTPYLMNRAPEVMIPLIASKTNKIRVGSGSVLLNHYSPYKVATNFAMLADMFPNRIDMGIGRATTGSIYGDYALQRNRSFRQMTDDSEAQIEELLHWMHNDFEPDHPFRQVKVFHDGNYPEFWLLGSSSFSAAVAAKYGLAYAFAGFINPHNAHSISQSYFNQFTPDDRSLCTPRPRFMLSLSIYCATTIEAAGRLAAPHVYMMQQLIKGDSQSPILSMDAAVEALGYIPNSDFIDPAIPPHYIIGTPDSLKDTLTTIAAEFHTEELMVQCIATDVNTRIQSLELLRSIFD